MPGGDGTGPMGYGLLTGRGLGPCGRGLRRGLGFGRGFGWRRFANAPVQTQPVELNKEEKIKILEADKEDIEAELKEVKKVIEELKK